MSRTQKQKAETAIVKMAHDIMERVGFRMYRNNIGQVRYPSGNWVRFGVCNPGGSDLIGWASVIITPDMVGQRVAIFTAAECKTDVGKLMPDQVKFLDSVRAAGGIAGVVRDYNEAVMLHPNINGRSHVSHETRKSL